jgi:excisionase family DNA binding protein
MVSPPELMTVRQVAELSGVDRVTVWRWVEKGVVPAVRVGPTRRIRITRDVFERCVCCISREEPSAA